MPQQNDGVFDDCLCTARQKLLRSKTDLKALEEELADDRASAEKLVFLLEQKKEEINSKTREIDELRRLLNESSVASMAPQGCLPPRPASSSSLEDRCGRTAFASIVISNTARST